MNELFERTVEKYGRSAMVRVRKRNVKMLVVDGRDELLRLIKSLVPGIPATGQVELQRDVKTQK